MADQLNPEQRSRAMSRVRRSDTGVERLLRSALHTRGARFRKNLKALAGSPDVAFTRARVAVFVDGCFWHGCPVHYRAHQTRSEFWTAKIERNRARDKRNRQDLEAARYTVIRFWECEVKADPAAAAERVLVTVRRETG